MRRYCSRVRWLVVTACIAAGSAFAGDVRVRANLQLGPSWLGYDSRPPRRHVIVPVVYPTYWYWFPVQQPEPAPPPPPAAPQVIIFERAAREEPAPPAPPPPQVIYIEQPAAPAPVAAPAPAVLPEPVKPLPPRTPGPDVYTWTDDDGVVHYTTRAPAPQVRAKKLATLAK